ncbi:hypothetical protein [Caudoviricetes sp.]|nr:hypothetical protein [Caudoviricetes sp.]
MAWKPNHYKIRAKGGQELDVLAPTPMHAMLIGFRASGRCSVMSVKIVNRQIRFRRTKTGQSKVLMWRPI